LVVGEDGVPIWGSGGGGSGGGGGVLVCHVDNATGALDKTWQEIKDAGYAILINDESDEESTDVQIIGTLASIQSGNYDEFGWVYDVYFNLLTKSGVTSVGFSTNSANGYPVAEEEPGGGDDGGGGNIS
jgi:hypothetical protein